MCFVSTFLLVIVTRRDPVVRQQGNLGNWRTKSCSFVISCVGNWPCLKFYTCRHKLILYNVYMTKIGQVIPWSFPQPNYWEYVQWLKWPFNQGTESSMRVGNLAHFMHKTGPNTFSLTAGGSAIPWPPHFNNWLCPLSHGFGAYGVLSCNRQRCRLAGPYDVQCEYERVNCCRKCSQIVYRIYRGVSRGWPGVASLQNIVAQNIHKRQKMD